MSNRYKMTRIERAKQFAPFDALTGLSKALRAVEEEYDKKTHHELSDDELMHISDELSVLEVGDIVRVNYFCAGAFYEAVGSVVKVDGVRKVLAVESEEDEQVEILVPFVDIKAIERM